VCISPFIFLKERIVNQTVDASHGGSSGMNVSELIALSTEVSQKLFLCNSKDEVNSVFDTKGIINIPDRIGLLKYCMGVKNISQSPEELTPEQEYEDELLIFLDGTWRFLI
jgi:hypothetical protein